MYIQLCVRFKHHHHHSKNSKFSHLSNFEEKKTAFDAMSNAADPKTTAATTIKAAATKVIESILNESNRKRRKPKIEMNEQKS